MNKPRYVTIKDLARTLKLSPATVSRALRNQPEVNIETRRRVQDLARAWDYQPNLPASSLVNRRSRLIGVMVPRTASHFFARIISGIQAVAYEENYRVIICETRNHPERERLDLEALLSVRVDGLIIAPVVSDYGPGPGTLDTLRRRGVPWVYVDREVPTLPAPAVLVDDAAAAREAVNYLVQTGCRRIAHLAGPGDITVSAQRRSGYREALAAAGLPWRAKWDVEAGFEMPQGYDLARQWLSAAERPDAILGVCDRVAIGAMRAAKELGIQIPGELSIIGFSDNPASSLVEPPLSTIFQPAEAIGQAAIRHLLSRLSPDTAEVWPPRRELLSTRLILRGTTRKLPV